MITAVLLGVIAVTLLSPDDDTDLFGVNVVGGNDQIVQSPPSYEPEAGGEGDRGTRAAGGATSGPPSLAFTGPSGPSGGTLGAGSAGGDTAPSPSEGPENDGGGGNEDDEGNGGNGGDEGSPGPPGDQYGDTLARLSDALD